MVEFLPAALAAMHADIDRAQARAHQGPRVYGVMSLHGTAGAVVTQLRLLAEDYPSATPAELVELLAEWCDRKASERPGWYTVRHMRRMIELAGHTADVIEWNARRG